MLFAVVPCYNASATLPRLLHELSAHVPPERTICINDGSEDETGDLLEHFGVRVIHHKRNMGKGESLRSGYKMALDLSATNVLNLDSDLQHNPSEIPKFIEASKSYDIVIGSRRKSFTTISSPMPVHRRLSNGITSATLTYLCGQPIQDSQSGFRLVSAACLKDTVHRCKESRFMFETEFLLHATRRGFNVGFVEIEAIYGTGRSYMRHVSETLNFLKLALRHGCKRGSIG